MTTDPKKLPHVIAAGQIPVIIKARSFEYGITAINAQPISWLPTKVLLASILPRIRDDEDMQEELFTLARQGALHLTRLDMTGLLHGDDARMELYRASRIRNLGAWFDCVAYDGFPSDAHTRSSTYAEALARFPHLGCR